jgi:hypothetical protein
MTQGGIRTGAGRPLGSPNRATVDMKARMYELAREYTLTAFETLLDVAENSTSDSARITAATAILDRGYGKPRQAFISEYTAPSPLDFDL